MRLVLLRLEASFKWSAFLALIFQFRKCPCEQRSIRHQHVDISQKVGRPNLQRSSHLQQALKTKIRDSTFKFLNGVASKPHVMREHLLRQRALLATTAYNKA